MSIKPRVDFTPPSLSLTVYVFFVLLKFENQIETVSSYLFLFNLTG